MSLVILVLNVFTPFSLGTFIYMCGYHPKEKRNTRNAMGHIIFTIFIYVMLIIFSNIAVVNGNRNDMQWFLILFFLFLSISYVWGIVFGCLLVSRVRRSLLSAQLTLPMIGITTTQIYHSNIP